MWNTILFDLDGTLTASAEGITKSVQYALEKMGIEEKNLNHLICFVGPPLKEQFMNYAGFHEEDAKKAVEFYRERYARVGIFENSPYEGIPQLLMKLCNLGYILGIASSKPEYFVKQILEHYQIAQYFKVAVGSEMDGSRTNKTEVIEEALRQLGITKKRKQVVMVGDKMHDVLGAKAADLPCIGVAYGYGGYQELSDAGADRIVHSVAELEELLLGEQTKYNF